MKFVSAATSKTPSAGGQKQQDVRPSRAHSADGKLTDEGRSVNAEWGPPVSVRLVRLRREMTSCHLKPYTRCIPWSNGRRYHDTHSSAHRHQGMMRRPRHHAHVCVVGQFSCPLGIHTRCEDTQIRGWLKWRAVSMVSRSANTS